MRRRFLTAVLDGVALPSNIYKHHQFARVRGTDLERLRSDVERVGTDFKTVIAREHGNIKTIARTGTASKPTR
jgi:hypothetical protein